MNPSVDTILAYIQERWLGTRREQKESVGNLIGLPHPFTVPCVNGSFQELYYWDTYFTSRGLVLQGHAELAKANCDNFIHLVETLGFIPNGSRTFYLNRSQPAFFGAQIELVMAHCRVDDAWVRRAAAALAQEVRFWETRRRFDNGLFHYDSHTTEEEWEQFFHDIAPRIAALDPEEPERAKRIAGGRESMAEAESGWDFTPRFERHCNECAAVDLNCLLYLDYRLLAKLCADSGDDGNSRLYREKAEGLADLIRTRLWDSERKAFYDYLVPAQRPVRLLSASSLFPLWVGVATPEQVEGAVAALESRLEHAFGVSCCEANDEHSYQWNCPNGWPPNQMIAVDALERVGKRAAARRVARKYIDCVRRDFDCSGRIWEKYNVVEGSTSVTDEYAMPEMMGWSAGTFVVCADYLAGTGAL